MSPHLRLQLVFPVHARVQVDVIIAGGLTLWPRDDKDTALSPILTDTRVGWSARAALGLTWLINDRWSLHLDIGYFVTSSGGGGVWVTHDTALLSLGPRVTF